MAAFAVLAALLVAFFGVQATSETRNKRQVVGPEVLPHSVVRVPFTMCQANLNDLVPCTHYELISLAYRPTYDTFGIMPFSNNIMCRKVSPLAVDCYQGKGSCCRGACVCNSYPNPCIVETDPYMVGRRKRAALARSYTSEMNRCKRSCLLECKTPYCSPGSNRNACKKACLRLCLEECNDNLV